MHKVLIYFCKCGVLYNGEKTKNSSGVKKYNLKEAEEADDEYWANKLPEYRLKALMDLREMTYGNIENYSMIKEVTKRKRY